MLFIRMCERALFGLDYRVPSHYEIIESSIGLLLLFQKSTTVEADFSLLGLEKNQYRKALTDLSLEGVLHSRQFLNPLCTLVAHSKCYANINIGPVYSQMTLSLCFVGFGVTIGCARK